MPPFLTAISYCIAIYLIGAIPFSVLICRLKGIDLSKVGSGNLGATNVYRALGLKYAILVFACDFAKSCLPVYVSTLLFENPWYHVGTGLLIILAHSFSVFVRFQGGKGVASGAGLVAAIHPLIFAIVFPIGVMCIVRFRYVSPVSIGACILIPILFWAFRSPFEYTFSFSLMCGVIICLHYKNILRIIKGEETKI